MDFERFKEYFNKNDSFSKSNMLKLVTLKEGYAEAEMDFDSNSSNFMGSIHGGSLAALADIAAGSAILSFGNICVTLSANINFIKSVKTGKIKAIAKAVHHGKNTGVSEVNIINEDKDLICKCSYTMFITSQKVQY